MYFQYRLGIASIKIECYPIVPDRILITLQKGWFGEEVFEFLSEQTILKEVKWNDKITSPSSQMSQI